MAKITGIETFVVRFPTSKSLDGSDAMNQDPDYSGTYLLINTDAGVREDSQLRWLDPNYGVFHMRAGGVLNRQVDYKADDEAKLRDLVGPDFAIAVDATQVWDVDEAITWINELKEFKLTWIEEPTDIQNGSYTAPLQPGVGAEMHQASIEKYQFPSGSHWKNGVQA